VPKSTGWRLAARPNANCAITPRLLPCARSSRRDAGAVPGDRTDREGGMAQSTARPTIRLGRSVAIKVLTAVTLSDKERL
jgi:hypothetical protein